MNTNIYIDMSRSNIRIYINILCTKDKCIGQYISYNIEIVYNVLLKLITLLWMYELKKKELLRVETKQAVNTSL